MNKEDKSRLGWIKWVNWRQIKVGTDKMSKEEKARLGRWTELRREIKVGTNEISKVKRNQSWDGWNE